MLQIKHVHKAYGAVVALRNVSLTIPGGEIVALLGANGSGKSTLVKVLGGTVKEDRGEIYIDEKQVRIKSSADSRRLKISVAYQELSLIPRMTVLENIILGHPVKNALGRIDEKKNREFASSLFVDLGVKCGLDPYVRDLPPAVLSLVEIIKAVSWKPDVLLLDEVTATLHRDEVVKLFAYLRRLSQNGVSVLMVTHRLGEIYQIASRAVILRNGESVADVNLSDCEMDTVVYHMTGKMPEAHLRKAADYTGKDVVLQVKKLCIEGKVCGADMTVSRGEIIGIGGLEGQGQSDFLRAIYGIVPHCGGEVLLRGEKGRVKDAADAVRRGIGFVSGDRNRESVFPIRPIGENIYSAKTSMGSMMSLLSRSAINKSTMRIIEEYGIKIGRISDAVHSLSGGNQQKVVFGRWIFVRPDILLLDDPTKGVDVAARRELHNFLKRAADEGMTVVMVSSDNDELLEISDRIYIFYEGGVHGVLAGEDKTEEKLVSAMMGL
ncbi:MAG: sugar ABC transporter ATP-binding protein [Clostridia bacterium]|nr:sugar ABC transporter ATP-binding protein [Clostridia bacterium]